MEIRRFFVQSSDITENKVRVAGDEFLHMTKVLRYKVGYQAIICANDGKELLCTLKLIGKDFAELTIDKITAVDKKKTDFTLYCGLLKNNKLDFTIQKGVELGVDRIVPFTSQNTAETKFNVERANKIALESAKQCGSVFLSSVDDVMTFDDMLADAKKCDVIVFAYEFEKKQKISSLDFDGAKKVALIVGAEGGFQESEVEKARECGAKVVTLGKRILRAETAGIVATALTLETLGELDYD